MSEGAPLRELQPGDLDRVHALLSNIEVVRHTLFPVHSRTDSQQFIREAPYSHVRAIMDDEGRVIGLCGIAVRPGSEQGELWYLLDPECWGRGIATRAACRLLRDGFERLRLKRIWASSVAANPPSIRVLEKIGMRPDGCLRENLFVDGESKDCLVYAISRRDWDAQIP